MSVMFIQQIPTTVGGGNVRNSEQAMMDADTNACLLACGHVIVWEIEWTVRQNQTVNFQHHTEMST